MFSFGRLTARRSFERSQQHVLLSPNRRLASNDNSRKAKEFSDSNEKIIPTPNGEAILPFWRRLGPVTEAIQSYGKAQKRRPYATQVATSIIIYSCGDFTAQKIGDEAYSPTRTARNVVIGIVCSIPAYNWYVLSQPCIDHKAH